jgi:hypothetical protein
MYVRNLGVDLCNGSSSSKLRQNVYSIVKDLWESLLRGFLAFLQQAFYSVIVHSQKTCTVLKIGGLCEFVVVTREGQFDLISKRVKHISQLSLRLTTFKISHERINRCIFNILIKLHLRLH